MTHPSTRTRGAICPSRFCFTSMGSNPVRGAKLSKYAAFSSEARKERGSPWKRTGVSQRGPKRIRSRSKKGASAAAGLQVDEVFRAHIVIHRVGKFLNHLATCAFSAASYASTRHNRFLIRKTSTSLQPIQIIPQDRPAKSPSPGQIRRATRPVRISRN